MQIIPIIKNINEKIRNIISIVILNYPQLFFEHNLKIGLNTHVRKAKKHLCNRLSKSE